MKKTIIGVLIVVLLTLTAIAVAGTQTGAPAEDKNEAIVAQDKELKSKEMPAIERSPGTVAYAWILGPTSSYDITVHVMNVLPKKQIRFVEVNPLLAKTGDNERLIIDAGGLFGLVAPSGGTINALYPIDTALPGAMVEFTGFDYDETAAFSIDPDTFNDPSYGATVSEMQDCLIKVWFSDGTTAGIGLLFDYKGNQIAVIQEM